MKKHVAGDALISCTTTTDAYTRLIDGSVDMIFVAAPSKKQQEAAKEQGKELEFVPIGKEAFVFFVNVKNKVDGLTIEQLRKIYGGEITNWRNIGGKNMEIQAFQRDEGSGSQSAFQRLMDGYPVIEPIRERVITGMGPIVDNAANYKNYPGSLGFSFRYYVQVMANNANIKLLKLNGVEPSVENIRNGSYPQTAPFYAVVEKNNPNPNIKPLLEWILSPQGQELIEKNGYVGN